MYNTLMYTAKKVGKSGFTLVELLVVIVVVSILASITTISYTIFRDNAEQTAAQTAASQAASQLQHAKNFSTTGYPNSVTDCPTPTKPNLCLKEPGVTYRYSALTPPRSGYSGTLQSPAYELSVERDKSFVYTSSTEMTGVNEFVQYMDMAPIINKYGLKKYLIEFEIKSPVSGNVNVYLQNGSGSRYSFSAPVSVSTNYTKRSVTVTPSNSNMSMTEARLAFYGTYGTGRIPTVKNVRIQLAP